MVFVKRYWFLGVIGIILFSVLINTFSADEKVATEEEHTLINQPEDQVTETEVEDLVIDLKGEVVQPGIYTGKEGMRVHEIVTMAGGFTEHADQTSVNLAQKVTDEMVVLVSSLPINEEEGKASATAEANDKVRINYATAEEITAINGIGPSKAEAIIQYREENGLFKSIEDLLEVSGIGEKTLETMTDDIQIP